MLKRFFNLGCGCLFLLVLLLLALIGLGLFLLTQNAQAAPLLKSGPGPLDIVIAVDQSPSMSECDGIGTDPDQRRVDAVQLFANYLGADNGAADYRIGLLHFGGEAQLIAPLSAMADASMRRQLAQAAENPQPIPWTDPLVALQRATQLLEEQGHPQAQRAILLLTDGDPAWPSDDDRSVMAYRQELLTQAQALAENNTALFIIRLDNPSTTCSQRALRLWQDVWREMTETTPQGVFFTVDDASTLMDIYLSIARRLVGQPGQETIHQSVTLPQSQLTTVPVTVSAPLESLTLIVWREEKSTATSLIQPDGLPLPNDSPAAQYSPEKQSEIWRIEKPTEGIWQVQFVGRGQVTVWYDWLPQPTPTLPSPPTHTPTAPAPPTHQPTPTPTPTATAPSAPVSTPLPTQPLPIPTVPLPDSAQPVGGESSNPPLWRWGALLLAAGGLVWFVTGRRRFPRLAGQLLCESGPKDAPPALSLDRTGRRSQRLGNSVADPEWRLIKWDGQALLQAGGKGEVVLLPQQGEILHNGRPARARQPLRDGDRLTFGPYRFRYENLLA